MAFCYQILLWRLLQIDADISRPYIHCHRHIWHCFPVCLSLASRRTKDQYCRSYIDHEDGDLLRFVVFLREVFWQLRLGCLLRFLYSSTGLHSISTQIIKFWRQVYKKQNSLKDISMYSHQAIQNTGCTPNCSQIKHKLSFVCRMSSKWSMCFQNKMMASIRKLSDRWSIY